MYQDTSFLSVISAGYGTRQQISSGRFCYFCQKCRPEKTGKPFLIGFCAPRRSGCTALPSRIMLPIVSNGTSYEINQFSTAAPIQNSANYHSPNESNSPHHAIPLSLPPALPVNKADTFP